MGMGIYKHPGLYLSCKLMGKKQKYYVVWEGQSTGIFEDWKKCEAQVKNYPKARYKAYDTLAEARQAFLGGPAAKKPAFGTGRRKNFDHLVRDSIVVDAACEGNPGILEYQGVDPHSGAKLFHKGPFPEGTVNIGEFLAIVHALAWLKQKGKNSTAVYSDSVTGLSWVKNRRVKTNLVRSRRNEELFLLVDRALNWLEKNAYENKLLKWDTEAWGENPADFGRK